MGGAVFVAGQAGGWTPIGVEQSGTGYQVAWKVAGADQYSVWTTDSNGNYVTNTIGIVSGSSAELKSQETVFHQDLNGDGHIGSPTTSATSAVFGPGNDTFVFRPGFGNEAIADVGTAGGIELDGFGFVTSHAELE